MPRRGALATPPRARPGRSPGCGDGARSGPGCDRTGARPSPGWSWWSWCILWFGLVVERLGGRGRPAASAARADLDQAEAENRSQTINRPEPDITLAVDEALDHPGIDAGGLAEGIGGQPTTGDDLAK